MAVQKAHRKIVRGVWPRFYAQGHKFKIEAIIPGDVVLVREFDKDDWEAYDGWVYQTVVVYAQNKTQTKCATLPSQHYHSGVQHFDLLIDHGTECVILTPLNPAAPTEVDHE